MTFFVEFFVFVFFAALISALVVWINREDDKAVAQERARVQPQPAPDVRRHALDVRPSDRHEPLSDRAARPATDVRPRRERAAA